MPETDSAADSKVALTPSSLSLPSSRPPLKRSRRSGSGEDVSKHNDNIRPELDHHALPFAPHSERRAIWADLLRMEIVELRIQLDESNEECKRVMESRDSLRALLESSNTMADRWKAETFRQAEETERLKVQAEVASTRWRGEEGRLTKELALVTSEARTLKASRNDREVRISSLTRALKVEKEARLVLEAKIEEGMKLERLKAEDLSRERQVYEARPKEVRSRLDTDWTLLRTERQNLAKAELRFVDQIHIHQLQMEVQRLRELSHAKGKEDSMGAEELANLRRRMTSTRGLVFDLKKEARDQSRYVVQLERVIDEKLKDCEHWKALNDTKISEIERAAMEGRCKVMQQNFSRVQRHLQGLQDYHDVAWREKRDTDIIQMEEDMIRRFEDKATENLRINETMCEITIGERMTWDRNLRKTSQMEEMRRLEYWLDEPEIVDGEMRLTSTDPEENEDNAV
ncbi:hypothetical protein BD324DRAFT_652669 [Kockovaella imperatae]|uniref:Uncharacterized protein n=1 Tax=Kockovaella imperatae TaxID=4999 RepID=A0A1Y1UBN7_9TREE|nr:hypothetical protein BD324DRAFT_652669 [Kockovaella imperatae]ORX34947.1 hypothetical protein BD324DRAFT_652669 [Kockovaella imperatae]